MSNQSRREFLTAFGSSIVGPSVVASKTTTASDGAWKPTSPSIATQSLTATSADTSFTDTYSGNITSLHSILATSINNNRWDSITGQEWWSRFIELGSNAIVYDESGNLMGNITHSHHNTSYSGTSTAAEMCYATQTEEYIGKYYGEYVEPGDYSASETVLTSGFNLLVSTAASTINPIYGASSIAIDMFFSILKALRQDTSYDREWSWDQEKQVSWFTKYEIHAHKGETVRLDTAESVDLYGETGALFGGKSLQYTAPGYTPSSNSFDTLSPQSYSLNTTLHKEGTNMVAHSGKYAKEHPNQFSYNRKTINSLGDNEVIYSVQTPPSVEPTSQTPDDLRL